MHLKKKQILLSFLIIVSISFPFFSVGQLNNESVEKIKYPYKYDLKISQWVVSSPIIVNESDPNQNWATTAASEPWCSGSGIWSDPYIIQDVTLDLQGASASCISIFDSVVYFQIKDCILINAGWGVYGSAGIYLENTDNGLLLNNNCSNHNYNGIYLRECENNTISGNIASNNQVGIELDDSHYNIITSNAPNANTVYGIDISMSDNNTITGNVLSFNSVGIFLGNSENTTVLGNTMSFCGISVYFMEYQLDEFLSNNVDISNTVNGKPVYYYTSSSNLGNMDFTNPGQIILINCTDSYLSNIAITYTSEAIQVEFCDNITIYDCDFTNNMGGISVRYSTYINITDSIAGNNEAGISLGNSENCTIIGNEVNNNADLINMWGYGINIGSCENCTIADNIASFNYESGLTVWDSKDLEIDGNTFYFNRYGIQLGDIIDCEIDGNTINGAVASIDKWDVGIYLFHSWGGNSANNTFKSNVMTNCGFFLGDYEHLEQMTSQEVDTSNLVNGKPVYYYTNQVGLISTDFTNAGQVFLINTNSSVIDNLVFSNTTIGIQMFHSSMNTISNCEFRYNKLNSFELYYSHDNDIDGNTFGNSNEDHLWLMFSNDNHITDNSITDDPVRNPRTGITLGGCNNTLVLRNDISNCYVGVMVNGELNSISSNNLSNNVDSGLWISGSKYSTIINNTINNNHQDGILLEMSDDNDIVNNTINHNNNWGLRLIDSNSNIVSDNVFRCNGQDCWLDEGGSGNTFIDNTCEDCPDNGNGHGGPGGVPGYNLIIIIGVLSIISVILLRKRYKH